MPIRAIRPRQANAETRTIRLEQDGESVEIEYRLKGYTADLEDKIHELTEQKRGARLMVEFLIARVVRWNIVDDNDGQPVPISYDALKHYDAESFLTPLVNLIIEDMTPNANGGTPSAAG